MSLIKRATEPTELPSSDELDALFSALAHPIRRSIVTRLAHGPATVNDLAAPLDVSLPAVSRHLRVLEGAGLIRQTRDGQRRPCHLVPDRLRSVESWLATGHTTWSDRLERLDRHLVDGAVERIASHTSQETPS